MEEHIIRKEDGTIVKWTKTKNNGYFCLLHNDNKQKYSFSPTQNLTCQLFMIGGGGAGGYYFGGGGGAGAAYINNNYTFDKSKSYSFEIGTGGKCDLDNISNLFKYGLNLKVYNNTTPKLDNISFTYDDYSSLGITSGGIVQSFVVNNINIPATIFNNNTTYIWDGYVIPNDSGFIKVNINSKIKTMIWIDKYVFTNSSALVDGININDVKVVQLDSNKFYNIKIIAYNFDTSNSNFNISFENCEMYYFDKTGEIYNYISATDTNLNCRNTDNSLNTIKCKGGGFGGCGLYNKNSNLDGGCGGGSGINKINGKAVIDPSFNGNAGAIGTYCGGGGGILSPGMNDKGGEGKKIEWFSNDLIFGAGGNAATFKETRNLGYGCGGNGGECCYFSKLLINNDGNNGCILIYVDANGNANSNDVIEGFDSFIGKTDIYLNDESIINKLIKESLNILKDTNSIDTETGITATGGASDNDDSVLALSALTDKANVAASNRYNYFDRTGHTFASLCTNESPLSANAPTGGVNTYVLPKYSADLSTSFSGASAAETDNNDMNNFIYDMIVISKLYAVVYRLYYYHFTRTLNNNITDFNNFLENVKFTFTTYTSNATSIDKTTNTVNINSLFDITNLQLNSNIQHTDYGNKIYYKASSSRLDNTDLNMDIDIYNQSKDDIGVYSVPSYHNLTNGDKLFNLTLFMGIYATNVNKITPDGANPSIFAGGIIDASIYNTSTTNQPLNIFSGVGNINSTNLSSAYTLIETSLNTDANLKKYSYQRIGLYLEQFNIIINTTPSIMLSTLKYKMYYYNAIVYNILIQYNIFQIQKNRIKYDYANVGGRKFLVENDYTSKTIAAVTGIITRSDNVFSAKLATDYINDTNTCIRVLSSNLQKIIDSNINTSSYYNNVIKNISDTSQILNQTTKDYNISLDTLNDAINKYNNDLDIYNTMNNYYKILMIICIIIIVIVIIIFIIRTIDNNTKIIIYAFITIIIIVLFILYNNSLKITENFETCRFKYGNSVASGGIGTITTKVDLSSYKTVLYKYASYIMVLLSTQSITKNTLNDMTKYINNSNGMKNREMLLNNNKIKNYQNASELLKKSANDYYYMIILIVFSIIIFMFGLTLYLLYPDMLLNVVIFAVIPFIILLFYVMYKINRSTRMVENKNYWATYNPSETTLATL